MVKFTSTIFNIQAFLSTHPIQHQFLQRCKKDYERIKNAPSNIYMMGKFSGFYGGPRSPFPPQKQPNFYKKVKVFIAEDLSLVIRLGLEPKTPTLKVLCSTS